MKEVVHFLFWYEELTLIEKVCINSFIKNDTLGKKVTNIYQYKH